MGLQYHADMKDATLSDLLRQAYIKNENQLVVFYYYSWRYFADAGRSAGAYIIFSQYGSIDHGIHIPVPVAQTSAQSD